MQHKEKEMQYRAIIFDMDGVLFETEDFYFQRRANFLASQGISIAHLDSKIFVGGRSSQIWPLILGETIDDWDIPTLEVQYKQYKEAHPTPYGERLFPEVKEALSALRKKGLTLVVASNSDRQEIERGLTEAGISSYFDAVFSAIECGACKPHPAVYEAAWAHTAFPKDKVLVIEDSEMGITAARAAGLEVWAIRDKKWGVNQQQAGNIIANLADLVAQLEV